MNIKEILKKIADGKELTEDEKKIVAEYNPDADESRIPKSRLDQESEKRKAAETKATELQSKLDELQEKIENIENAGSSESEKKQKEFEKQLNKLKADLATITADRDKAKTELETAKRTARISEIANKYKFTDAGYLDFLAKSKDVQLDDDTAVAGFVKELEGTLPQLFQSTAKSGGGTTGSSDDAKAIQNRIDELLKKTELSSREAGEVITLQGKLAEQQKQTDGQ